MLAQRCGCEAVGVPKTAMELASEERIDLAATLEALRAEDWDRQSLCQEWSVRDVVAHILSYEGLDAASLGRRFLEGRFSPDRINSVGVATLRSRPPEELVRQLRSSGPSGLTAGFGGRIALTDTLIHHEDIRIPLGLERDVPHERLRVALPFAMVAPPIRGAWRARGLRVIATDLDWSFGRGPEVRGRGQAVLLAVTGRSVAAAELDGPGADTLRRRLS